MPSKEAPENWETALPAAGITVVCLLDSTCGSCMRQRGIYNDLLVTYPEVTVLLVGLHTYPAVRHKYGIGGSVCTMLYKDGLFQKRFTQSGVLEYSYLKTYIERLKNNQPLDRPEEIMPRHNLKPTVKLLGVPVAGFAAWLASDEGQKISLAMQTKIWYNAKRDEYEVAYLWISSQDA